MSGYVVLCLGDDGAVRIAHGPYVDAALAAAFAARANAELDALPDDHRRKGHEYVVHMLQGEEVRPC